MLDGLARHDVLDRLFRAFPRSAELAEPEAGDGRHEHFKSTRRYDGAVYRKMHGLPVEGDSL